jgi:hypothetical protein
MKLRRSRNARGFAVIVALVAITVLTLLAGAFAYAMKVETRLAANSNDDEQFYWLGRGGVERACWWLSLEGNQPFTSLQQYWAGGPGDGAETNSPLAAESLDNFAIGPGTVSLKFTELDSRINVNTADAPLLQQVLTSMGVDASDISVVSDSILDWIDSDDATRPAGAESDYYQGKGGYNAKNAPIDNLDELLLIKGVTRAMYEGGSETNEGAAFAHHHLGLGSAPGDTPNYPFGLRDVFTPFSTGHINLLTADENVLSAIFGADSPVPQGIETARNSDPPVRNVNQLLVQAGASPADIQQFSRYFGIRGDVYQVVVTATIGSLSHDYTAVLFRTGPNVQVVSFYRSK